MNKHTSLKKFIKEFPRAAKEVEYSSGIDIFYHDKSFWLNGELQLTGYAIGKDGEKLDSNDNEDIAIARIREFKECKARVEKESLVLRFSRLIGEAKNLVVRYKHYTTYRHPSGDKATIFDDGDLWINFTGIDYQIRATGKKNRKEAIDECIAQFEAYTGASYDL